MTKGYMINQTTVTIYHNGEVFTANVDAVDVAKITTYLEAGWYTSAVELMDVVTAIAKSSDGRIVIEDYTVYCDGVEVNNSVTKRILQLHRDGKSFDRIGKFLTKVQANPSFNSREQLFRFLEANNLPIAEDGNFLAYKYVNARYYDSHTDTIPNRVGDTPMMKRSLVNDDPNQTCSHGLHVCSEEYIKGRFGRNAKIMIVSVDPAHVVAVPHDYQNSKMRTCQYTVVAEHNGTDDRLETVDYDQYDTALKFTQAELDEAKSEAYDAGYNDGDYNW
jgi:hypothetical protein